MHLESCCTDNSRTSIMEMNVSKYQSLFGKDQPRYLNRLTVTTDTVVEDIEEDSSEAIVIFYVLNRT